MSELHVCPRRAEVFSPDDHSQDTWRDDHTCSFCGSMNPDLLLKLMEEDNVELGPTDKNYKVYVDRANGWRGKFYFQHFDTEQQQKFIDLLNSKKVRIGFPGHFYRLPFFCRPAK